MKKTERKIISPLLALVLIFGNTSAPYANKTDSPLLTTARIDQKTVIHVQDVYGTMQAEKKIDTAMQDLVARGNIELIALEGSVEAASRKKPLRKTDFGSVSKYFLKEKDASFPPIIQVDDQPLYQKNLTQYQAAKDVRPDHEFLLSQKMIAVRARKTKLFNLSLRKFDAMSDLYYSGRVSLPNYVEFLSHETPLKAQLGAYWNSVLLERRLDYPQIREQKKRLIARLTKKPDSHLKEALKGLLGLYETGQIKPDIFYQRLYALALNSDIDFSSLPEFTAYQMYLKSTERVDRKKLTEDLNQLEIDLYTKYTRTKEEKALVDQTRYLRWVRKLIRFDLNGEEWLSFRTERSLKPPVLLGFSLRNYERFYEACRARDRAMVENLLEAMEQTRSSRAILVTGKFPPEGVQAALSAAGVHVVTVVPPQS